VCGSTIDEMISERRHHEHPSLIADVRDLCAQVSSEFPDLDCDAYLLVVEAQRYVGAREEFLGRLLDEGAQAKDFSLLDPEEYLAAARIAAPGVLAEAPGSDGFRSAVAVDGSGLLVGRAGRIPAEPATGPPAAARQ
jgi:hypothetical protein